MYTSARIVYQPKWNQTVTLQELNEALFQLHIPALVFVTLCMVIGIVGNVLVMFIYKNRFRRSNHRYFILFLAIMDFLACVTGMPFLVASLRLPYMINSAVACKVLRYFHYFVNNSSGLLLVVISIERFRKICRPFKKQLTTMQTLYLCWGTLGFSAVMAAPAPYFFTATAIDTGINNISGTQCYADEQNVMFEYYQGLLMAETVLSMAIFIVLYVLIVRKLWTNDQFLIAMRSLQANARGQTGGESNSSNEREYTEDFESDTRDISDENTNDSTKPILPNPGQGGQNTNVVQSDSIDAVSHDNEISLQPLMRKGQSSSSGQLPSNENNNSSKQNLASSLWRRSKELLKRKNTDDQTTSENGKHLKRSVSDVALEKKKMPKKFHTLTPASRLAIGNLIKQTHFETQQKPVPDKIKSSKTTVRVTLMLIIVSMAFVISFVPHLSLMLVAFHQENFLDSLSRSGVMVFQVFLRIFILNNVVNPIIYLFCDTKFRKECRQLFYQIFYCKRSQNRRR